MSEDRLKRRRFLADVLFAGSAVAGAGLLSRWAMAQKPDATSTPVAAGTPSPPQPAGEPVAPRSKGDVACPPSATPSASPTPPHPVTGGKPVSR